MKTQAKHSALIFCLAIATFGAFVNAELYKVSYLTALTQGVITVPAEATYSIQSYSVQGWVRPSQTMDFDYPSKEFRTKFGIIFGVSTSQTGWGNNVLGVDAYLTFYINKWSADSGFIMGYDTTTSFNYLYTQVPYNQIFGRWFFLYGAYHADLKKTYFATLSTVDSVWTDSWSEEITKNPINGFFQFSVGTTDIKQSTQFNGYVQDSDITYSPIAKYYQSVADLNGLLSTLTSPTLIGLRSKQDFTFIGEEAPLVPSVQIYGTYQGAEEYAVSGQIKFTGNISKMMDSLIFRLSTNNPEKMSASYTEGDRALSAFVQKGKTLCFATYSIQPKSTNVKLTTCFPEATIIDSWIYFYQGYSRSLGRVFSYYRVGDQNFALVTSDVYHVDPNAFYLSVAKDVLTNKLEGTIRSFTLEFGPGAYRETVYDSLPPVSTADSKPLTIIPKTYQEPKSYQSDSTIAQSLDAQIVDAKYLDGLKQFAIHFWFRRDITSPIYSDFDAVRQNQQAIAGVTEKEDYVENPALSITYRSHEDGTNAAYIFRTYNDQGVGGVQDLQEPVEFSGLQDQGQWHWIYYGYDKTSKEASYTVKLSDGTTITKLMRPSAHPSIGSLKAMLGASGSLNAVPGEFYDFQFVYYHGCYANSEASIQEYQSKFVNQAPDRSPIPKIFTFSETLTFSEGSGSEHPSEVIENNGTEILNYSFQTWAIWDHTKPKSDNGNILLFASLYDPTTISNPSGLGEIILQISVFPTEVRFTTYHYDFHKSQDIQQTSETIPIQDYLFDGAWCYYNFGHSQGLRKATGSVQCDSGLIGTVEFKNVQHIVNEKVYFAVGSVPFQDQWLGQMYKPTFIVQSALITDLPVSVDRPAPVQACPIIYGECNFQNEIIRTCDDVSEFSLDQVKSLYLPQGLGIVFYRKVDFKGVYVEFIESVDCMDAGLKEDPFVSWSELEALFNEGKLIFSDSEGQEISMEKAKIDFLGGERTHQKRIKQQTLGSKSEPEEKGFFEKLMFWRD